MPFDDNCTMSRSCAGREMVVLSHVRDKVVKAPEHDPRDIVELVERNLSLFGFEFLSFMKYKKNGAGNPHKGSQPAHLAQHAPKPSPAESPHQMLAKCWSP